jgi:hypothetical protein
VESISNRFLEKISNSWWQVYLKPIQQTEKQKNTEYIFQLRQIPGRNKNAFFFLPVKRNRKSIGTVLPIKKKKHTT